MKYQGLSYFEKREFDKAINNLTYAKEINAQDPETYFYLGSALGRTGEGMLGLKYLNKSQQLLEPSPKELSNIFSEIAYIYQEKKDYQLALEHLRLAYRFQNTLFFQEP